MVMLDEQPALGGESFRVDPFVQLAFVHESLDDLASADLAQLDDEWLAQLVVSIERVKVRIDAATIVVAAEAERRHAGRDHGFFTTRAFIQHHGRLSGPEARQRMQIHRMFTLLPDWRRAAESGNTNLGDAQLRLMARVASNPRIHDALVIESLDLLADAETLPYDQFERRLRDFERSADFDGARRAAERAHDTRDTRIRQQPDGSWKLAARFGSLQGAEINDILAHFNDAQFRADWEQARLLHGDDTTVGDLERTEPQRRADALHNALLQAASSPGAGLAPLPCLDVLIDETTLEAVLSGQPVDPHHYRDMVCRTTNGDPVDVTEAASLALWARVRRVVRNSAGVVTELGRRSRVFRGANRDAATLLTDRCIWPGCDRQLRHCQVDHNVAWAQHGTTDPDNGGPMCGPHNRLKHRAGFSVERLSDGSWLILDARRRAVS